MAGKREIAAPHSKLKEDIVRLLSKEGYIRKMKVKKEGRVRRSLVFELIYEDKRPKLTNVVRMSKPGRRVYVKKDEIPRVLGGLGRVIISTPKGLMTGQEARKKGLGGEAICKIW